MTAPFAPPPSPVVITVVAGLVVVALAIPFAERDDWIGTAALVAIFIAATAIWALLLSGFVRAGWQRWRKPSDRDRLP